MKLQLQTLIRLTALLFVLSINFKCKNSDNGDIILCEKQLYKNAFVIREQSHNALKNIRISYDTLVYSNQISYIRSIDSLSNKADKIYKEVRHDFITALGGNQIEDIDTLMIDQIANLSDKTITASFIIGESFSANYSALKEINDKLSEIYHNKGFSNSPNIEHLMENSSEYNALQFLLHLTLINNEIQTYAFYLIDNELTSM